MHLRARCVKDFCKAVQYSRGAMFEELLAQEIFDVEKV